MAYLDLIGLTAYTQKVVNWDQYTITVSKNGSSTSTCYISAGDAGKLSYRHPLIINLNWISTSTSSTCSLYIRNGGVDPCTGATVDYRVCDVAVRTKDKTTYSASDRGLLIPIKGSTVWSLIC